MSSILTGAIASLVVIFDGSFMVCLDLLGHRLWIKALQTCRQVLYSFLYLYPTFFSILASFGLGHGSTACGSAV